MILLPILIFLVLSLTFFIAWYSGAIKEWPTEISRIGGTVPAYYVFAPGVCFISLLLCLDLTEFKKCNPNLVLIICISLCGLAVFDHYNWSKVHSFFACSFFTFSIILLYPHIQTNIFCMLSLIFFIIRGLLHLIFWYLTWELTTEKEIVGSMSFKIRSIFQWLVVFCLLCSLGTI